MWTIIMHLPPTLLSGKPTVALNIYKSMRQTDCSPNVVTYNTLIDVYGKLGQWEDAVRVIDVMQREVCTQPGPDNGSGKSICHLSRITTCSVTLGLV